MYDENNEAGAEPLMNECLDALCEVCIFLTFRQSPPYKIVIMKPLISVVSKTTAYCFRDLCTKEKITRRGLYWRLHKCLSELVIIDLRVRLFDVVHRYQSKVI